MEFYKHMDKIELGIYGLSYSKDNIYTLIFKEKEGERILPIPIGNFEAQAIALSLEKVETARPMTHDLIKSILDSFLVDLREVVIYRFEEGVFYSMLVFSNNMEIDSRTSDAVAIALKYDCKINTYDKILNQMSELIDSDDDKIETLVGERTIDYLKELLDNAIEEENYEEASNLRDEIDRMTKKECKVVSMKDYKDEDGKIDLDLPKKKRSSTKTSDKNVDKPKKKRGRPPKNDNNNKKGE